MDSFSVFNLMEFLNQKPTSLKPLRSVLHLLKEKVAAVAIPCPSDAVALGTVRWAVPK